MVARSEGEFAALHSGAWTFHSLHFFPGASLVATRSGCGTACALKFFFSDLNLAGCSHSGGGGVWLSGLGDGL